MKRILAAFVGLSVLAGSTAGAFAAERPYAVQQIRIHNDHRGDRYDNRYGHRPIVVKVRAPAYHRGARISRNDWNHARRIDYRAYHLRRPAKGYEWREVNGRYVEAAIVGGLIATIIIAASR